MANACDSRLLYSATRRIAVRRARLPAIPGPSPAPLLTAQPSTQLRCGCLRTPFPSFAGRTPRGAGRSSTAAALMTCSLPIQEKAIAFEFERRRDRFIQSAQATEFIEYRVDTRLLRGGHGLVMGQWPLKHPLSKRHDPSARLHFAKEKFVFADETRNSLSVRMFRCPSPDPPQSIHKYRQLLVEHAPEQRIQ